MLLPFIFASNSILFGAAANPIVIDSVGYAPEPCGVLEVLYLRFYGLYCVSRGCCFEALILLCVELGSTVTAPHLLAIRWALMGIVLCVSDAPLLRARNWLRHGRSGRRCLLSSVLATVSAVATVAAVTTVAAVATVAAMATVPPVAAVTVVTVAAMAIGTVSAVAMAVAMMAAMAAVATMASMAAVAAVDAVAAVAMAVDTVHIMTTVATVPTVTGVSRRAPTIAMTSVVATLVRLHDCRLKELSALRTGREYGAGGEKPYQA